MTSLERLGSLKNSSRTSGRNDPTAFRRINSDFVGEDPPVFSRQPSLVANRLAGRSPRSHPYGDARTDTRGDRISVAGQTPPKAERTGHRIPQIEYASYPRTEVA